MPRVSGPPLPAGASPVPDPAAGAARPVLWPDASPPSPRLRRRQRSVCTFLVAAGVLLAVAAVVGRPAVLVLVLAAQVGLALLGGRLLPAADRWAWLGALPGPAAAVVLATDPSRPPAVLAAALGAGVALVLVTEVSRAAWAPGPREGVEEGGGRVERLSQNVSLTVLVIAPALALAVRTTGPVAGRWWVALGVAEISAGIGVRLGGSIVRAGGLSVGSVLRRPTAAVELIGRPIARAVGVDVLVTAAAFVVAGAVLAAAGLSGPHLWVPALLAAAGTPLVLAGATSVLALRGALAAGALACGLALAAGAPLALLLSVQLS